MILEHMLVAFVDLRQHGVEPWEIHPMLVAFPVAFLVGGAALDVYAATSGRRSLARTARGLLVAGLLTGILAAAAGLLAFFTLPTHTERAHEMMLWHAGLAAVALLLGAVSVCWRRTGDRTPLAATVLGVVAAMVLAAGGHIGGKLVFREATGVNPQALAEAGATEGHGHDGGHAPRERESKAAPIAPAEEHVGHGQPEHAPPHARQEHPPEVAQHDHPEPPSKEPVSPHAAGHQGEPPQSSQHPHPPAPRGGETAQSHSAGHEGEPASHAEHPRGLYGAYPMTREASGTAWQPDSSPMHGEHERRGEWSVMTHGFAFLVYDHQGGKHGDDDLFVANMLMLMGQRPWGSGTLGLRGMFSLEAATIGEEGYPLLFQTGETADGVTPLVDAQHPHDLFMELAATYSVPLGSPGDRRSVFGYVGLPGEPALGPPTFMHRFSGMENPEAPLGHHWLDSTHITFGVATLGWIEGDWKLDASVFNGAEPDQHRWGIEEPDLDSWSGRLTWNPTRDWSLQASFGALDSPEQLEPGVDVGRTTTSAMWSREFEDSLVQTTLAFGRNDQDPGETTDAVLLESAWRVHDEDTWFGRLERVEKNELFPAGHPLDGEVFPVVKLSLGYSHDFARLGRARIAIGGLGSVHWIDDDLEDEYGDTPTSFSVFLRAKM